MRAQPARVHASPDHRGWRIAAGAVEGLRRIVSNRSRGGPPTRRAAGVRKPGEQTVPDGEVVPNDAPAGRTWVAVIDVRILGVRMKEKGLGTTPAPSFTLPESRLPWLASDAVGLSE